MSEEKKNDNEKVSIPDSQALNLQSFSKLFDIPDPTLRRECIAKAAGAWYDSIKGYKTDPSVKSIEIDSMLEVKKEDTDQKEVKIERSKQRGHPNDGTGKYLLAPHTIPVDELSAIENILDLHSLTKGFRPRRGELWPILVPPSPSRLGYGSSMAFSIAQQMLMNGVTMRANLESKVLWETTSPVRDGGDYFDFLKTIFYDAGEVNHPVHVYSMKVEQFIIGRTFEEIEYTFKNSRKTRLILAPLDKDGQHRKLHPSNFDFFRQEWKHGKNQPITILTDFSINKNDPTIVDFFHDIRSRKCNLAPVFYEFKNHHLTIMAQILDFKDEPLLSMLFH